MKNEVLKPEILGGIEPFQGLSNGPSEIVQSGGVMQQVKTAYTTAVTVQKPRSLTTVVKNVIEEARLARAAFYFKWPVKNRKTGKTTYVQGGSIDLARSIARNFGNVAVDITEEPESISHFTFKATFIDLESGLNWPRLFRQRKSQNTGMGDKERAEDIIYQIGQSKAQRNAVFQGVPGWLVDKAIEVAEQAEIDGITDEGIEIVRAKVLDHFGRMGVDQDRIENKIGKKLEKWSPEDVADLRAAATAIKEGRERVEVIFPIIEPPEKPEPEKKAPEKKKAQTKKKTGGGSKAKPKKTPQKSTQVDDKGKSIEDLVESEEWSELMDLKKKSPKHYLKVTQGQTPQTVDEVMATIDEIRVQIEAEADRKQTGIPGA